MNGVFNIELLTVEKKPLTDFIYSFRFKQAKDSRIISSEQRFHYKKDYDFLVPAYPQVAFYYLDANPSHYRPFLSDLFRIHQRRKNRIKGDPFILYREPKQWKPKFTRWRALGPEFASLKQLLSKSEGIWIRGGKTISGPLSGNTYDSVFTLPAELNAKMALLNLRSRLSELEVPYEREKKWFDYIEQILVMNRERFVAFAKPGLYDAVAKVISRKVKDYKKAPSGHHADNFPKEHAVSKLISIKSKHDKANLQITAAKGRGGELVDVDLDENSDLLRHLGDLFRHIINGGTHPIDIREYLIAESPTRDLGYRLVTV